MCWESQEQDAYHYHGHIYFSVWQFVSHVGSSKRGQERLVEDSEVIDIPRVRIPNKCRQCRYDHHWNQARWGAIPERYVNQCRFSKHFLSWYKHDRQHDREKSEASSSHVADWSAEVTVFLSHSPKASGKETFSAPPSSPSPSTCSLPSRTSSGEHKLTSQSDDRPAGHQLGRYRSVFASEFLQSDTGIPPVICAEDY
jgi:hypothetical protein